MPVLPASTMVPNMDDRAESAPELDGSERRRFPRKPCAFDVVWISGSGEMKGIGFEVSQEGIVFALPAKEIPKPATVRAIIRSQTIELDAEALRASVMQMQGRYWTKYACQIVKVDEGAWTRVVDQIPERVAAQPVPPSVAALLGPKKAAAPTDAAALSPEIKNRIAQFLVKKDILDAGPGGAAPAVTVAAAGEAKDAEGKTLRSFKIEGTRQRGGAPEKVTTTVIVAENGNLSLAT